MLLALAGVSSAAMAQQKPVVVEQVDIIQVQDKYQVITNPFWSNWFFSIGGGASVMYGDNDQELGDFGKRISPTMNISVNGSLRGSDCVCSIAAFRQKVSRQTR